MNRWTRWLRRLRGALGMGVTWAVGWAIAGLLIGVASILLPFLPWELFFDVFDAPLPALAWPGFFAGAAYSVVLGIAGRRRRFDELSVAGVAAWGAVAGAVFGLLPVVLFASGGAALGELGFLAAVWGVPVTVLSAASAAGTLMVARKAEDRELLEG